MAREVNSSRKFSKLNLQYRFLFFNPLESGQIFEAQIIGTLCNNILNTKQFAFQPKPQSFAWKSKSSTCSHSPDHSTICSTSNQGIYLDSCSSALEGIGRGIFSASSGKIFKVQLDGRWQSLRLVVPLEPLPLLFFTELAPFYPIAYAHMIGQLLYCQTEYTGWKNLFLKSLKSC